MLEICQIVFRVRIGSGETGQESWPSSNAGDLCVNQRGSKENTSNVTDQNSLLHLFSRQIVLWAIATSFTVFSEAQLLC